MLMWKKNAKLEGRVRVLKMLNLSTPSYHRRDRKIAAKRKVVEAAMREIHLEVMGDVSIWYLHISAIVNVLCLVLLFESMSPTVVKYDYFSPRFYFSYLLKRIHRYKNKMLC